jgi:predicted molibdopterin-dependent oxidoreductase YjgC
VEVRTARGAVRAAVRVSAIRDGVVFLPFHYGYWDADESKHDRAANELTPTDWDPVSKQPIFKTAAAAVDRVGAGEGPAPAAGTEPQTHGGPAASVREAAAPGGSR